MHLSWPRRRFAISAYWLFSLGVHNAAAQSVLSLIEKEISTIVSNACPSVVTVSAVAAEASTSEREEGFLSFLSTPETTQTAPQIRVGSGLIITSDGFILTKYSVIENAREVYVTIVGNHRLPAEVAGVDSQAAIAVLRVSETTLTPSRLGRTEVVVPGAWAIAIGNSMGMPHSVSLGTVNGLREDGMMQISVNADPGYSGSPVFNSSGEAVGLIAAVVNYEREEESFSSGYFGHSTLVWPMSFLLPRVQKLIDDYYAGHGWLGVTVNRAANLKKFGVQVVHLDDDGPGKKAGIRLDDIITHFDGQQLKKMSDLRRLVLMRKPGDKVEIGVLRQEAPVRIHAEIGRRHGGDYFKEITPAAMNLPAYGAPPRN